jgi:hypothetical protein
LGTHLVQRGAQAQWDFFHNGLRDTVLRRDLTAEDDRRRLHGALADHLVNLPAGDPLRIGETMVHLLGRGDRERATAYVAAVQFRQWTDADAKAALAGAVAVLVEAIQAAADEAERERLTNWIAVWLVGGDADRCSCVANAIVFDLNDALAVAGTKETERARARLLRAARRALDGLATFEPTNAGWQRDLSVNHLKIGDVLRVQGDAAAALAASHAGLTIRERLAAADPSNADWQRDLSVSCWRMADIAERSGSGDAQHWWGRAYAVLSAMQQRGIMLATDGPYLETLRRKAAR